MKFRITILTLVVAAVVSAGVLSVIFHKANGSAGVDVVNRGGSYWGHWSSNSSAALLANGEVCVAYDNTNGTAAGNEIRVNCYDQANNTFHGLQFWNTSDLIASGKVSNPCIAMRTGDRPIVVWVDKNTTPTGRARSKQWPGPQQTWRGQYGGAYDDVSMVNGTWTPVEYVDVDVSPTTQRAVVTFGNGRYVYGTHDNGTRFRGHLQIDPDLIYFADPNTTVYGWISDAEVVVGPAGREMIFWSGQATQQYNYAAMLVGHCGWDENCGTNGCYHGKTKTNGVVNALDWLPVRAERYIDVAIDGYGGLKVVAADDPIWIYYTQHSGVLGDKWTDRNGNPGAHYVTNQGKFPTVATTWNNRVDLAWYNPNGYLATELGMVRSLPPNGAFRSIIGNLYEERITEDTHGQQWVDEVLDQYGKAHFVYTTCVGTSANCTVGRIEHVEE